ncbi:stage II sporulation protein M [Arsukibacterium sp.]|uniref:stage II sporulation protein M n=1 Tax=Arsukibacterium sp. TaxID=1977258 RepID=UPI001BD539CC|nr:stage II sporulation protein M [Arsukibacterium sp.]
MKQSQFVRQREALWRQLEQELTAGSFTQPELFPAAYRQLCSDLSLARSRQYSPVLVDRLNQLVALGQQHLYQNNQPVWLALRQLIGVRALQACYQFRKWIWLNLILFYGLGLAAAMFVCSSADNINYFMSAADVEKFSEMYDPASRGAGSGRTAQSDVMMFGFYIYNNIGIAFQTFAGGLFFCIGALFYIVYNGLYLGAVAGHMINMGFNETFFSFVIGHGSVELTAIVLSGAAGCRLGFSLLVPGIYDRLTALKLVAHQVMPIVAVAFVMLVLAAGIEAFWSPRQLAADVKYIVGAIGWAAVFYWLYRGTVLGR